ncbi:MAG TPA: hypothetical protein DCE42_06980, partial [Myxococcales bacterium]|nr:hypothetical protein [Myxococcales bacterium]
MDTSYADRQDVSIATGSHVEQCVLEHVQIGPHCKLIQCVIRGTADSPVIIDAHCELIQCQIEDTGKRKSFQMNHWKVNGTSVFIGAYTKLHQTRVENASVGAHTTATRATILHSEIGPHNTLRSHGNFTLVKSAEGCNLGSEISKTILNGQGFVSEHTASYLSLIAPSTYPIVNAQGKEQLLEGLPNLTNIGAGTVFANYSGKPRGANTLAESPGSQKGTALVF